MTRKLYATLRNRQEPPLFAACVEDEAIARAQGPSLRHRARRLHRDSEAGAGGDEDRSLLRDGEKLVSDSFDIALISKRPIPIVPRCFPAKAERPWLASSRAGRTTVLHPAIGRIAIMDIHDSLDPIDGLISGRARGALRKAAGGGCRGRAWRPRKASRRSSNRSATC